MDRICPLMAHRKHFLPFCFRNESRNSSKTSVDSIETVRGRLSPLIKFNCYSWNLKQVAIRNIFGGRKGAERWKINEVKGFVNFNSRDSELIFRGWIVLSEKSLEWLAIKGGSEKKTEKNSRPTWASFDSGEAEDRWVFGDGSLECSWPPGSNRRPFIRSNYPALSIPSVLSPQFMFGERKTIFRWKISQKAWKCIKMCFLIAAVRPCPQSQSTCFHRCH